MWRLKVEDKYGIKKLRFVFYGGHVGLTPSGRGTVAKRGGERGWRQAELVVVEEVEL